MTLNIEVIDNILHGFKVKYVILDKLFSINPGERLGTKLKIDTVNVFINLESLYNSFRNETIEKHLSKCDEDELKYICRQLIAGFINVGAHYRNYFNKNFIKSNIVYYYNEVPDTEDFQYYNSLYVKDYRAHFFESMHSLNKWGCNSIVQDAIPLFKIICMYLEDIFVVGTTNIESSCVPFVIDMNGYLPSNMNLFVTRDPYDFQYANHKGLIITKMDDDAILVAKKNLMKYVRWKHKINEEKIINPLLYNFMLSCVGDRKRSIKGIKGFKWNAIYKELVKLYKVGYIFDEAEETMHIANLTAVFQDSGSFRLVKSKDIEEIIHRNWKAIDLAHQLERMEKYFIFEIKNQLVNKYDPESLINLNNHYFDESPIHLYELNQFAKKEKWQLKLEKELGREL